MSLARSLARPFRRLAADATGGALVEFGMLAPFFIALMIGVVQIGMYMQNYTAVHSLAADASRFATVEYQKTNSLSSSILAADIVAMGATTPYNLDSDRLTVNVTEVTPSDVNGSKKFTMNITYSVPTFMSGVGFSDLTLNYTRPLYVLG